MPSTLHEWLYGIVVELCRDREYVYVSYVRHFSTLMQQVLERGKLEPSGSYEIPGIKSPWKAQIEWALQRRIDLMGANALRLRCQLVDTSGLSKPEFREAYFDLSSGENIETNW